MDLDIEFCLFDTTMHQAAFIACIIRVQLAGDNDSPIHDFHFNYTLD